MAEKKVAEKVNALEKNINDLEASFNNKFTQLLEALSMPHKSMREEHFVNTNIEGESIHHIHFHGGHQYSSHQIAKLEIHKFDGFNPTVWVEQMEQYFHLNNNVIWWN